MRTIRTRELPGGGYASGLYSFYLDGRSRPPVLHIPGEARGPDVCIPESAEQERWLDGLPLLLTRTWDCQWTFNSERAAEDFLRLLRPFEVEGTES